MRLDAPAWPGSHQSLAEVLLEPSVIYAPAMLELARRLPVHAFAHVTGGGIPGNLVRVLPDRCDGVVRRGTWDEPRVFAEIQRAGDVPDVEMQNVFNLGVGMLAVVPGDVAERALDVVRSEGHDAWIVGEVVDGHGYAHVETR
jgi:phosphoribosylformylglycinamidine cyclo-ligase